MTDANYVKWGTKVTDERLERAIEYYTLHYEEPTKGLLLGIVNAYLGDKVLYEMTMRGGYDEEGHEGCNIQNGCKSLVQVLPEFDSDE